MSGGLGWRVVAWKVASPLAVLTVELFNDALADVLVSVQIPEDVLSYPAASGVLLSIHSFTHSFFHHSFICSFIHSFSFLSIQLHLYNSTHSFIPSFLYPFIPSFFHPFIPSHFPFSFT